MLRLENLRLSYPDFELVASWSTNPSEIVALVGPSGAGKSTLLMAIAGFLQPTCGRILWQGQDITRNPPADRPVSILFQDQNLFPHLTILQNLSLALSPNRPIDSAQRAKIEAVLDRLGLSCLGARRPADLSGGQQGRAALARILLQNRPVLLLDEPFAALGPALKADLLALVRDMTTETGALVLLVTHDPQDALHFADKTVLVADGVAFAPVPTLDLFGNPPQALQDYMGV